VESMDNQDNLNELLMMLEEAEANPHRPVKSCRQLLREFPHISGIRMLAQREYEALQDIVEVSKYVGAYGWNSPTGRPRREAVFSTAPPKP
jgi:hypothetical protein